VIATSHLDSQWNWTVQDTIREFVPNTFFENFKRFEKYPDYTFNYEGAIHYMWFKEYHPESWPTVQKYVADGRWRVAGSWMTASLVGPRSSSSALSAAATGNNRPMARRSYALLSSESRAFLFESSGKTTGRTR